LSIVDVEEAEDLRDEGAERGCELRFESAVLAALRVVKALRIMEESFGRGSSFFELGVSWGKENGRERGLQSPVLRLRIYSCRRVLTTPW